MSYFLLPKTNNDINININIQLSRKKEIQITSNCVLQYYERMCKEIIKIKTENSFEPFNDYENIVENIHPYECIYKKIPGSKLSVSKLKTNSLLFYDFLEINQVFDLFNFYKNKPLSILNISPNYEDLNYYIEMIKDNNDEVLSIPKLNAESYQLINKKYDFIYFEDDFDLCDEIYSPIHINGMIKALLLILYHQTNEGTSLIKISNTFYKPIIDVLYLFSSFFEKVYIMKPTTTNSATFEKYIICKNFNANKINTILPKIEKYISMDFILHYSNNYIFSIIDEEIPYYFINKIHDLHSILGQQQLEIMEQVINLLKTRNKEEKIETIKRNNIQKSISWCEKFKIPYNKFVDKTNIFLPVLK
jgi:hypothetical protein